MKYIYYEIKYIEGGKSPTKPKIENVNILLFNPKTNSNGIRYYNNKTLRHYAKDNSYTIVKQHWIDLTKYKDNDKYTKQAIKCAKKLKINKNNKYIYFDIIHKHNDYDNNNAQGKKFTHKIINENILLSKPKTNSSGIWGFTSIDEDKTSIQQHWINLEKYNINDIITVNNTLELINIKLREQKLNRILNH